MPPIFYVSSPASAGKSFAMLGEAHRKAVAGKWVLVVLPTLRLKNELLRSLDGLVPLIAPQVIDSSTTENVTAALLSILKQRSLGGRLVFVTWSAFERLPFFPSKSRWHVYIDEVPQVWSSVEVIVPQTHRHLTEHLKLIPQGPAYARLLVSSPTPLNRLATTDDAALAGTLAPIARTLRSPNVDTYTKIAPYDALLAGTKRKLTLHFLLKPKVLADFERVTIFAANFEHSLLYKIWSTAGVLFIEDQELVGKLRFRHHANGPLVRIHYAIERPWSKRLRDKEDSAIMRALAKGSAGLLAGEPFLWAANKDVSDTLFEDHSATRLPQVSHGLNSFDSVHNVIDLSARLPTPKQFAFLAWRGVTDEDVRRAVHLDAVYQTVMRCSIRNLDDHHEKRIIVPDRAAAEHLRALLPGSSVVKMDIGLTESSPARRGRERKFDDTAARVRAHRAEKKAQTARLAAFIMDEYGEFTTTDRDVASLNHDQIEQKTCNESPYIENRENIVTSNFHGSIFEGIRTTRPCAVVTGIDINTFITALKKCHSERPADKESNRLISPAFFDQSLSDTTSRGLANVAFASGIWIDVDAGDMTHQDFSRVFPSLRIVAFNSFSSTKYQPRFRIFIPTSRTMSKEEYASIFGQIVQTIQDSGFPLPKKVDSKTGRKAHGIDLTKRHAASLFFLPCQPKDQSGKIWKEYKGGIRKPLDIDDWLENAIPVGNRSSPKCQYEPQQILTRDIRVDHDRVNAAKERWYREGIREGNGDREMFRFAREMEYAGVPFHEAQAELHDAAMAATSPKDRQRQVDAILRDRRSIWSR